MQKYCSEECQAEAKRLRKKRQQDLINGIEPIMDLQHQEYLTFSKAAILMGCTRQYIYKLVANGKLKASRLSSRMAFVRKADIEKMFEGNPYKRVIPASKSMLSKKAKTEKPTQNQEPTKGKEENEVLDYYSGEEVMSIYKVKKSWLYTSAKRNQIPMCRIAGKNYYSKRHIDEFFGTAVDIHCITEWVTADDVEEAFSMSKSALRAYTYRHKIPTKRVYGRTYKSRGDTLPSLRGYRQRALRFLRQGEDERRFPCLLQETGGQEELQVATRLYALSYLHARQVYLWGDKRGLVQQVS